MTAQTPLQPGSFVDGPNATRGVDRGVLVITPKGPSLSEADAAGLLAEVSTDVAAADGPVLLDMARVEYMSSAGISMLVQLREACGAASGTLALCGLASSLSSVLKTTRVDRLFTIAKTRDKALAKLGR